MRIRNLVILVMVGFSILMSLGFTAFFYQTQRNSLESGVDRELLTAAIMAKDILPEHYHERITGKDSITDAEYLQVVERFNVICKQTGMEYLWSLMILDGKIVFTSGTSPGKDASQRDQAAFLEVHSNPEFYTRTFETMRPEFELIEDKWGRLRAILVPYYDAQGRKYLVGASRRMQEEDAQLQNVLVSSLLLGGGMMLLGTLISFILANALARPIDELIKAASKIAAGDYTHNISSSPRALTYGEVASLANSFELMKQAVQTREESLQKSEEKYRLLTENIKDVVWIMDSETMYFTYVSPSVERLRGYTPEEILAQPMTEALTPQAREYVTQLTRSRAADILAGRKLPGEYFTNEVEQPRKDGSTVWTEVITSYRANPENGRVEVLGVTRDISERKQAEEKIQADQIELQRLLAEAERSRRTLLSVVEDQRAAEDRIRQLNAELERRVQERTTQLAAANQELEAFSYSVSHDLRAPLRTLDGFSTILITDFQDKLDKQGQHYLARIQEASRHMAQLIENLLRLSRITQHEIYLTRVDLSSMASQIAGDLQAQSPDRRVEFEISSDMIVQADPGLMKITLENLISNALKFTAKREVAHIQVGMFEQSGTRTVFVRDNGAGFDMAYASKLFTPFQRLHGANEYPGSGIGLSIVQRIIVRHGGRIWSEAVVDQGAAFYFTLGSV